MEWSDRSLSFLWIPSQYIKLRVHVFWWNKNVREDSAREIFADTDVYLTTQSKQHLKAALGSKTITEECVNNKVQGWTIDITNLRWLLYYNSCSIWACVHVLSNHWSNLQRTVSDINNLLQQLENAIHQLQHCYNIESEIWKFLTKSENSCRLWR